MENRDVTDTYIGLRLKARRVKLGLSQADLAHAMSVSHQLIQKQESGEARISASMLFSLARALGVTVNYFFEGYEVPSETCALPVSGDIIHQGRKTLWNIFVAEDSPEDEALFRQSLPNEGKDYRVHVRYNGLDALAFLRRQGAEPAEGPVPDIVFLDLNLPKMNGFGLLKEIKQSRNLNHIPVIILTNSVSAEEMYRCYQLQAAGYLCKPLDLYEFRRKIQAVLAYWTEIVVTPQNY